MIKNTIIIALILLAIYLYYQNKKLTQQPTNSGTPLTVFNLGDENQEELIAEKDQAIRDKNEAEAEVLSLSNKLKLKQQETTRKEQEIERVKKEKSQVEIAFNEKIKELKKDLTNYQALQKKYRERERLLDEEQTDNNKLTEENQKLQKKIAELEQERNELLKNNMNDIPLLSEYKEWLKKEGINEEEQKKYTVYYSGKSNDDNMEKWIKVIQNKEGGTARQAKINEWLVSRKK